MKKIINKFHNTQCSFMRRNCTMRFLALLSLLVSGYGIAEAAYTYKLLNADGEVVAVTENTTNKYELPWYMESPYVTAYHFWDNQERTGTSHAKGETLSLADGSTIYVTYDVDTSRAPFDKTNGTYSITINGKMIYAQTSGIYQSSNNSYTDAALWTVSGDPYSLKIHPKADASQWIQTANASNGTEFKPGTSSTSTVMLIKGRNNNNADNIIMCANNGQTVTSDTRPQANWYGGRTQLKIWLTTDGGDKIAFTEEINPDDLFTVILVDKQGNEVFNVKGDASTGDPLPRQYRSPFAENYKYYETKAEAQANSGTETDWDVADKIVYVGYDVVSNFGGDNAWNIYGAGANGKYVHPVYQKDKQNKIQWWLLGNQIKDCSDSGNIDTSTFPFLDNSYAWLFAGDTPDPYNALLKNKGTGMYVTHYNDNRISDWLTEDASNTSLDRYSIVYFDNNASSENVVFYNRSNSKFVVFNSNNRLEANKEAANRSTAQPMVVTQLPQIDINVVNANGDVELTLPGYYKDGATWNNSLTPFYLQRAYTSGHTFYYDAACTDAITGTVDNSKINGAVYVKYTLASYWGTLSENEYTSNVMPSPTDGKLYWYSIRPDRNNNYHFKANSTATPTEVTGGGVSDYTTADPDAEASKLSQWALMGTPYNLTIVNRFHGTSSPLGIAKDATLGTKAYVYQTVPANATDKWEVVQTYNTQYIYIRPQGSVSGENPLVYLSYESGVNATTFVKGIHLKYVKETTANTITFKLYDKDGNYMADASNVLDYSVVGASVGDTYGSLFANSTQMRRYCDYTFYSDEAFTTEVTAVEEEGDRTIYVKWDYSDDAPVFSQGSDPENYQYYIIGSTPSNRLQVTGNATDGFSLNNQSNQAGAVADHQHQFALVGNPYSMRLYSRMAGKCLGYDGSKIVFADATDDCTEMELLVSGEPTYKQFMPAVRGTGKNIYNNTGNFELREIIVPLSVFKEGATAQADIKDMQEYAFTLDGRATNDRIATNMLNTTDNSIGTTHDYQHAFCDYTFYGEYNGSTLSAPVADDGLPIFGGKEQKHCAFFATYTVDEEQFDRLYLIANVAENQFTGKGAATSSPAGYGLTIAGSLDAARADTENTFRWLMTGDPYNLQLTCLGTGDNYQNMPLSAKDTGSNNKLYLTSDTENYTLSHFELIQRPNGHYVFFLIDNDGSRFQYHINPSASKMNELVVFANGDKGEKIVELMIEPAIPQYNITWTVVDNTTHEVVATTTVKNVEEGTVITLDNMPADVRRHYCDYSVMYSDQQCTTAIEGNTLTVAEVATIYVPYTLDSGAPDFSTEIPEETPANDNYWYEIAIPHLGEYIYYAQQTETLNKDGRDITVIREDATNWPYYRWALIGTPYGVQLYNRALHKYLTTDGETLTLSDTGTTFDLMDDWQGELAAIYDEATQTYVYRTSSGIVSSTDNNRASSVEFSNQNGLMNLVLVLHYSDETMRMDEWDMEASMQGQTENIDVNFFQKKNKSMLDVLPGHWKRAFCQYTFHWNNSADATTGLEAPEVTEVTQDMVDAFKSGTNIYVHVTYDYETDSPFEWSKPNTDNTDKHWYYLVNNHRQGNEKGKMVYRASEPILHINTGLVDNRLYLNNFEWCVIGDPYGFKLLNHYDPDLKYNEYISVTENRDSNDEGQRLEQVEGNANCIFEMMPGHHDYNFWMHPIYDSDFMSWEYNNGNYHYVGNNYNGSAAIISDNTNTAQRLTTNGAANFRLEIQSDATLAEYVKYAGFVGGLKYDLAEPYLSDAEDGSLSDENKAAIRQLIDNPENIIQMKQGYYRIIPYAWEQNKGERRYVRGYIYGDGTISGVNEYQSNNEANSKPLNASETEEKATYDPASIFLFDYTTHDGSETGYPRYYMRTQGLNLYKNLLTAAEGNKCRYEDLGAAITQLKTSDESKHEYLSSDGGERTNINQCFDEQAGISKTRFYLQPVGEDDNQLPFLLKLNVFAGKSYSSLYVPFDVQIADDCDVKPFFGQEERKHQENGEDVYSLYCLTLDHHNEEYGEKFIPGGTPVVMRSETAADDIVLTLPTDKPTSDEELAAKNKIKGTYLQIMDTRHDLFTFGRELGSNGLYTGRVGFFHRTDARRLQPLNNNRVFYISPFYNTSGGNAKGVVFDFVEGETTGISEFNVNPADNKTYDLQGREVKNPTRRGVYIMNGKKYIKK